MKTIFILVCLLVALACAQQQQQCSFTSVGTIAQNIDNLINNIKSKFDTQAAVQSIEQQLHQQMGPCFAKVSPFIVGVFPRKVSVHGKGCFIPMNQTDIDWVNDPCCNVALNKCCTLGPRKALVPEPILRNVTIPCNDPEKIKGLVRSYYRNIAQLQINFPNDDFDELNKAVMCVQRVVNGGEPCQTDADCDSNACHAFSKTCLPGFGGINWGRIASCFLNTPAAKFYLLKRFNMNVAPGAAIDAQLFANNLKGALEAQVCVDSRSGALLPDVRSKSACENPLQQRCEDRDNTLCNNFYCRVNSSCSSLTGVCVGAQPSPFAPFNNAQNCSVGACRYNIAGIDMYYQAPASACATTGVCSEIDCSNQRTSNRTQCESFGFCQGPSAGFKCPVCQKLNANLATCATSIGQGCQWDFARGACFCNAIPKSNCEADSANLKWVPPLNRAQCEADMTCALPNGAGNRDIPNQQDCVACGGKWVPKNTWRSAVWMAAGTHVADTFWTNRVQIPLNRWVLRLNDTAAKNILADAMKDISIARYRNFLKAKYGLQLLVLRTIACSCGDVKGEKCFAANIKQSAGEVIAVPGNNATFTVPSVTINIRDTSLFANRTAPVTSDVRIEKNVDAANNELPPAPPAKRQATGSSNGASVKSGTTSKSTTVGAIVAESGVSLGTQFDGSVQVCISADSSLMTTASSSYTKAAFAANVNGELILTSISVTKSEDNVFCGDVSNTETYYAALVLPTATPDPESPKTGAAATSAAGFIGMLIMLVAFFFL